MGLQQYTSTVTAYSQKHNAEQQVALYKHVSGRHNPSALPIRFLSYGSDEQTADKDGKAPPIPNIQLVK